MRSAFLYLAGVSDLVPKLLCLAAYCIVMLVDLEANYERFYGLETCRNKTPRNDHCCHAAIKFAIEVMHNQKKKNFYNK